MFALRIAIRQGRHASPTLESLDERIAPTSMSAGLAAPALSVALRAEVGGGAHPSAVKEAQLASEKHFALRVARVEKAIARTEVHLARAEARHHTHAAADLQASLSLQMGKLISLVSSASSSTNSGSLPANVPPLLATVYQEYEQWAAGGEQNTFTSSETGIVEIEGTNVGIEVHDGNADDYTALGSELQSLGMQITTSSATYGTYVGFLPIAQLPAVAQLAQGPNLSPLLYPLAN